MQCTVAKHSWVVDGSELMIRGAQWKLKLSGQEYNARRVEINPAAPGEPPLLTTWAQLSGLKPKEWAGKVHAATAGKALILDNGEGYTDSPLPGKVAEGDRYEKLLPQLGFEVERHSDSTDAQLRQRTLDNIAGMRGDGALWISFSGHGSNFLAGGETFNQLCCVAYENAHGITAEEILLAVKKRRPEWAGPFVLVLDMCRSGGTGALGHGAVEGADKGHQVGAGTRRAHTKPFDHDGCFVAFSAQSGDYGISKALQERRPLLLRSR